MAEKSTKHITSSAPHCPVLLDEVLEHISPKKDGKYLDCTFGAGGYTKAILKTADCYVTGLDQDPTVKKFVDEVKNEFVEKFDFVETNFADAKNKLGDRKFDGIVLDLGISSMQVDTADRGFSFMHDGPLDMRMGNDGISAKEFIAVASEQDIANIIYKYGEEVQSRQIAQNIVKMREIAPIETTLQLADIVRDAMHYRKGKIDPATKTFQAIRIHINRELESIERLLADLEDMLLPGGRILVVSFHSLEDSIVKSFFKEKSMKKVARSKYSTKPIEIEDGKWLNLITKKPIVPSREEVSSNPRSRSARLRVAEKMGGGDAA